MEPTPHQRPETAHVGTRGGGTDESSEPAGSFWRERTIDEIAAQQGVSVPQPLDDMIGAAANLWDDDEDFARFLQGIRDGRMTVDLTKRISDPQAQLDYRGAPPPRQVRDARWRLSKRTASTSS